MCGEATGLVVPIAREWWFGTSLGDSEAVLADAGVMTDLTANQWRKPLLGSDPRCRFHSIRCRSAR
jgi:hypothetical protein